MKSERSLVYPVSRSPFLTDRVALLRVAKLAPGFCTVCGSLTVFRIASSNLRETLTCARCRSFNRQRQVADVVCAGLEPSLGIRSLNDLHKVDSLRIYNTEAARAIHNILSSHPGYQCSEFVGPNYRSGETVNGLRHEDLQQLSFGSATFDLVLSGDVFEHVPDPYQAHREVLRVLKPGGRHVFTVPFYQESYRDEVRARANAAGEVEFLVEPLYHSDPVHPEQGSLVYTVFGLEMLLKLDALGFDVRFHRVHNPWHGILGPNGLVFEAIKPETSSQTAVEMATAEAR